MPMLPTGYIVAPRRVLLVEPSPADRTALRRWLALENLEVYEATDIMSTLAACQVFRPGLILLQVRLATLDGYQVIRRLKNDPNTRSIPVVLMAAAASTPEKAHGIDMGAVDFITRPFDPVELLARVHSALRTKALLDLLEQRAHLDGLTELGNRFALEDHLPREWESCRSSGEPLSVLIADLDHFKRINDTYGHAAGDEVLRFAARALQQVSRPNDFLVRYGGEEFVVVAPGCDASAAVGMGERFREAVAGLRVSYRTTTIQLTSSVGIAWTSAQAEAGPPDLLAEADAALYRAKAAGRNAVCLWDGNRDGPTAPRLTVASERLPLHDLTDPGHFVLKQA